MLAADTEDDDAHAASNSRRSRFDGAAVALPPAPPNEPPVPPVPPVVPALNAWLPPLIV